MSSHTAASQHELDIVTQLCRINAMQSEVMVHMAERQRDRLTELESRAGEVRARVEQIIASLENGITQNCLRSQNDEYQIKPPHAPPPPNPQHAHPHRVSGQPRSAISDDSDNQSDAGNGVGNGEETTHTSGQRTNDNQDNQDKDAKDANDANEADESTSSASVPKFDRTLYNNVTLLTISTLNSQHALMQQINARFPDPTGLTTAGVAARNSQISACRWRLVSELGGEVHNLKKFEATLKGAGSLERLVGMCSLFAMAQVKAQQLVCVAQENGDDDEELCQQVEDVNRAREKFMFQWTNKYGRSAVEALSKTHTCLTPEFINYIMVPAI